MFSDVFKRVAFLIIYLPGLIYGCQYAYYLGLTEPINANLAELGLSNNEVLFLGLLKVIIIIFDFIDTITEISHKSLTHIFYFVLYILICFLFSYFGIHKSRRHNFRSYFSNKYYELKYYFTYLHKPVKLNPLISFISTYFIFIVLIVGFSFVAKCYYEGINETKKNVYELYGANNNLIVGTVSENSIKYQAYKVACGSYKCIGLDLDKNRTVTFLPENYKQDFSFKKFSEKYKLAENKQSNPPNKN